MPFAVMHENDPKYKGLAAYAAPAGGTTPNFQKALEFTTRAEADAYCALHPKMDDTHKPAHVVRSERVFRILRY